MDTILRLQIAIGIVAALYLHGHALDTSLIAVEQAGDRHLIAMSLCPAHIHPHQHRSPVLSLRTAGTRVYLQHRLHGILLLTEHVLQFQILDGLHGIPISLVDLLFRHHLIFIEVESQLQFVGQCTYLFITVKPAPDTLHLLHLLLGPDTVFPEVWCLSTKILLLILHLLLVYLQITVQRIRPLQHIF